MQHARDINGVRIYHYLEGNKFIATGVVTLEANLFPHIVSVLSTTSSATFQLSMEELFGCIDAQVLSASKEPASVSINYAVFPEQDQTKPAVGYTFARVSSHLDGNTFTTTWNHAPSFERFSRTCDTKHALGIFKNCGFVVKLGTMGVQVSLSLSEPCNQSTLPSFMLKRMYFWLRGVRRIYHSYLLKSNNCMLLNQSSQPHERCSSCGACRCDRCVYRIQYKTSSKVQRCNACFAESLSDTVPIMDGQVTTESNSSYCPSEAPSNNSNSPSDVAFSSEAIKDFRSLGRTAAMDLISLVEAPMTLLKDANNVQQYQTIDESFTTTKSVLSAPAYNLDTLLRMLSAPTNEMHKFIMVELFGKIFEEGNVLAVDGDDFSINWSVFQAIQGSQSDMVYLKYNQRINADRAVSVWHSISVHGAERWSCAQGNLHQRHGTWGFVLERRARTVNISFVMTHPNPLLTWNSHWMSKTSYTCLSNFCDAVLSHHVTETIATKNEVIMFTDEAMTCYMCTKNFSLLRAKQFCCLCSQSVCIRCCEQTRMLQQGYHCDARVCRMCIGSLAQVSDTTQQLQTSRSSANSADITPSFDSVLHKLKSPSDRLPLTILRATCIHPFLQRRPFRPFRETNNYGIDFSDYEDDATDVYCVRGSVKSYHSVQDLLTFFDMATTENFRYGLTLLFGSLFVDGRVLHASDDILSHSSVNWLVLRNPKTEVNEHCDYVFLKVNSHHTQDVGYSIWESADVATHPPMPKGQSVPVQRLNFRRTGFTFEALHDGGTRIHFMTTSSMNASVSTKAWMTMLARCVRHVTEAVLCTKLASQLTNSDTPIKEQPNCLVCAKSFNLLRQKHPCAVCGYPACKKCSTNKKLLQALVVRELRVCLFCCSTKYVEYSEQSYDSKDSKAPKLRRNLTGESRMLPP